MELHHINLNKNNNYYIIMNNIKKEIYFSDLIGQRIDLVKIDMNGLENMHEYSIKPEFYEHFEYEPFKTIQETEKFLRNLIELTNSGIRNTWFIKLKKENKMIGTFDVRNINRKRLSAEVGYGISPNYWRHGFFSESLILVLRYMFLELNFYRIEAVCNKNNIASIEGLKKSGFKEEGQMRGYYKMKDNTRQDGILLSMIQDEFLES